MDRRACWAAVHGVAKESGMTTTYFTLVLCVFKKKQKNKESDTIEQLSTAQTCYRSSKIQ